MEVARAAFVCGLISVLQGLNFPPVRYRFPVPSRAAKAPLGDEGVLFASDPATGYPTQRWIFPPDIALSQGPIGDNSFIPPDPDVASRLSYTDAPGQAGPVATPLPDGLLDDNVVDLPPDDLMDRNAFIPLQALPGKSQRPPGLPRPPVTLYRMFSFQPVEFPEGFQPGQIPVTQGPSTESPIPSTPPPTPTDLSTDTSVSADQIWLSPSGLILPFAPAMSKTSLPSKVIPIQPVFPAPSKGYAVPDLPPPGKNVAIDFRKQPIPENSLNIVPRPGLIVPGFGSVRTSDPYINGYIAALNSYNPTPPDRIRDNPSTGTVTLSNGYGDLWVLKKDSEKPYFERLRIPLSPSGPAFGSQNTVSPSSSPKSNMYVVKKGPKGGRFYPQKGVYPLPPQPGINVLSPVPANVVQQPCPIKTPPQPTNKPFPRPPAKAFQITGKGNPYPGFNTIAPYSYVTWNPSGGSYLYSLPALNPPAKSGEVVPRPAAVRETPRMQLSSRYWGPIPEQSRPGLVVPQPDKPVVLISPIATPQMTSEPAVDSSSSPDSPELSSVAPPSSSEGTASESVSLELESQLSPVTALKPETPISRSTEDTENPPPADISALPKPLRYRSYVFRYDYNAPDGSNDRISRLIPLGLRDPSVEQNGLASGNPLKFHKAVSYLFREDGHPNEMTTENVPQPYSSEQPATGLDTSSSSEESINVVPVGENIDRER